MGCFSAPKTTVQQASTMNSEQEALLGKLLGITETGLNQPYQGYQGQRVAGFSPLQQQSFGMAGQIPGATAQAQQALMTPMDTSQIFDPLAQQAQSLFGDLSKDVLSRFAQTGGGASGPAQAELARQARGLSGDIAAQVAPYSFQAQLQNRQGALQAAQLPGQAAQQMYALGSPQQQLAQSQIGAQQQIFQEGQPLYNPYFSAAAQLAGMPAFENIGIQQAGGLGRALLGPTMQLGGQLGAAKILASDREVKENIEEIDNPLDKCKALKLFKYNYKGDGTQRAGLIAQDVEKVYPEAVVEVDGVKHVDLYALQALIIAALGQLEREAA